MIDSNRSSEASASIAAPAAGSATDFAAQPQQPLPARLLFQEGEDARITGCTRSLGRRLLALNIGPMSARATSAVLSPDLRRSA